MTITNITENQKIKQRIDANLYSALRLADSIHYNNNPDAVRFVKEVISNIEDNIIHHEELGLLAELHRATKKYDSGTVNGDVYPRGDTIYPGEKYFLVARGGLSRFERIHGTKVKYDYLVDYFNEELEKLHERQGEYNR